MICGDLIFYNNRVFVAYDKTLLVGAGILGVTITSLKQLQIIGEKPDVYRLKLDVGYSKRKKMADYLVGLIQQKNILTFKERINFHKVVNQIYKNIFKVELLEHNSIPVTIQNMKSSELLEKININA